MRTYEIDPELLAGFIDESLEGLEPLDTLFIELENNPENLELVNTIFRPIHSIKGSSPFFGLLKIKELAHRMEDLLDKIRQKKMKISSAVIRILLPGLDLLRMMFDNLRAGMEETVAETKFLAIIEPIIEIYNKGDETDVDKNRLASAEVLTSDVKMPVIPADRRTGTDRRAASKPSMEKTMRVSEKSIDSFLSYVSELVVVEEMFNYLQKKLIASAEKSVATEFKRVIETFGGLSSNLRRSILTIRMVPARSMLQKAPRIIHDIAAATGKKVNVQIEGDETQIDKSFVEMLDAPFTHMVRNAVDHGIEPEEERIAAEKPATGLIRISLRETEKEIELVIADDGKGLDYVAITKKAEEIGIVAKGQSLDENTVVDLLFMSGVSTAKEVTDVSGRGVGMDVAKKNVEAAGGKITIESKKGRGSTFVISLPRSVSTQIMDGFIVRTGRDIYVMPMELIGESFALNAADIHTVKNKGEMILRRGELFPVVRLGRELNKDFSKTTDVCNVKERFGNESVAISVTVNNRYYALCVDEIVGVQKVVVREIDGVTVNEKLFDGAAMLGDGSVAMIIGVEGLGTLSV